MKIDLTEHYQEKFDKLRQLYNCGESELVELLIDKAQSPKDDVKIVHNSFGINERALKIHKIKTIFNQ